jgi:hypothetical protein
MLRRGIHTVQGSDTTVLNRRNNADNKQIFL